MAIDDYTKNKPLLVLSQTGTVLGTSNVVDTSGYKHLAFTTNGAGNGSSVIQCYTNFGTTVTVHGSNCQTPVFIGSYTAQAVTAPTSWQGGSFIGDQTFFIYGTTGTGSFNTFVTQYD